MKETTIHDIIWIGKTKSIQSWGNDVGADIVKDISKLESDLKNKKNVMYPPQFRSKNKIQIHELLNVPLKEVEKKSSVKLINAIILASHQTVQTPLYKLRLSTKHLQTDVSILPNHRHVNDHEHHHHDSC